MRTKEVIYESQVNKRELPQQTSEVIDSIKEKEK